jgi:hypothetical protein
MNFKQMMVGVGAAAALVVAAGAAQAAPVTVNLGPSTEVFTLNGLGGLVDGNGILRARYSLEQGEGVSDGTTTVFTLSGAITTSNVASLATGTYAFVTSYDGPIDPIGGPNAPRAISNAGNQNFFNYNFLHPSLTIDLFLYTPGGAFVQRLFGNGMFDDNFSFNLANAVCAGLPMGVPCSQYNVGLHEGATFSGNTRITATFDTATLDAVPEPATWAMMLMGFGGLGAVLRSRRRVVAA